LSYVLPIIAILTISGIGGFSIGNVEQISYDFVQLEDNGWGPQQYWAEPYCDQQKVFNLKNVDENKTLIKTTKHIWHKYCNV